MFIIKNLQKTNFVTKYFTRINSLVKLNKLFFCNITRLNVDKLNLDKLDNKSLNDINIIDNNDKVDKFDKDNFIIEYGPETKWEEDILKCEIPVVVDCYAE